MGERRGFEGQDDFVVQHATGETTTSDTLCGLAKWLPVTSVMLNALCVDRNF